MFEHLKLDTERKPIYNVRVDILVERKMEQQVKVMQDHPCTFSYKFPVDEWNRIGGLYSLADVPVVGHKVFERQGKIMSQDSKQGLYEIKDTEKGWPLVVPVSDVTLEKKIEI